MKMSLVSIIAVVIILTIILALILALILISYQESDVEDTLDKEIHSQRD